MSVDVKPGQVVDEGEDDTKRPGVPVRLRADGLLWLLNSTALHPRGFALAAEVNSDGEPVAFHLLGDGTEPWHYADDTDPQFAAVEALLERARVENRAYEEGRRARPRTPGEDDPLAVEYVKEILRLPGDTSWADTCSRLKRAGDLLWTSEQGDRDA